MVIREKKLHIRYKFNNYEFIVADSSGNMYQLPHFSDFRTKQYRKIKQIKVGGSIGYRINRKFITLNKLRKLAYKVDEYYTIEKEVIIPF